MQQFDSFSNDQPKTNFDETILKIDVSFFPKDVFPFKVAHV